MLFCDAHTEEFCLRVKIDRLRMSIPEEALEPFRNFGAVIMQLPEPPSADDLLSLRAALGASWHHQRSEPNGLAVIEAAGHDTGFLGTMAEEHPPHTDGAYSDVRPGIVLLACEHADAVGGESVLISAALIHSQLRARSERLLARLYAPDALMISRNGMVTTKPAFDLCGSRVRIRFRRDRHSSTIAGEGAGEALSALSALVADRGNWLTTQLRRGEVLMVDNFAVLHGRTAFDPASGRRRLLRLNLMGDGAQALPLGFEADAISP
jgi:alpha-ketoglutarate-dependent taurine dioxygenase